MTRWIGLAGLCLAMVAHAEDMLDTYGGYKPIRFDPTGFFRVDRAQGRHWLVTPEGHAFLSVGWTHIQPTPESFLRENFPGSPMAGWSAWASRHYKAYGFHSYMWGHAVLGKRAGANQVAYTKNLCFTDPWTHPKSNMPDPWSEVFRKRVSEKARQCEKLKDDPWLLGYKYGDAGFSNPTKWVNFILEKQEAVEGKAMLIRFYKARYQTIGALNKVYGTRYSGFEELAAFSRRHLNQAKDIRQSWRDEDDFLGRISEAFHRYCTQAIRLYDPKHLIFGTTMKNEHMPMAAFQAMGPYVDVAIPQHCFGLASMQRLVDAIGKPIIFSDEECGNPPMWISTWAQAAALYQEKLTIALSNPNVLGMHFCGVLVDEPGREHVRVGLYDVEGNPQKEFFDKVSSFNNTLYHSAVAIRDQAECQALDAAYPKHMTACGDSYMFRQSLADRREEGWLHTAYLAGPYREDPGISAVHQSRPAHLAPIRDGLSWRAVRNRACYNVVPGPMHGTSYWAFQVPSDHAQTGRLFVAMGESLQATAYLNQQALQAAPGNTGLFHPRTIHLRKGGNTLLFRIVRTSKRPMGSIFYCRILDANGRPLENLIQ